MGTAGDADAESSVTVEQMEADQEGRGGPSEGPRRGPARHPGGRPQTGRPTATDPTETIVTRTKKGRGNPYTQVSNALIDDERLSAQALGVAVRFLSRSGWSAAGWSLQNLHQTHGDAKVRSAVKELTEAGYLTHSRWQGDDGRWKHRYEFNEASKVQPRPTAPEPTPPAGGPPARGKPTPGSPTRGATTSGAPTAISKTRSTKRSSTYGTTREAGSTTRSSSKRPAGADDAKTAAAAAEDPSDGNGNGNGNGRTSDESQVARVWAAHLQAVREWLPDTRAMTPAERRLIERNLEAHGFDVTISAVCRHGESYLVRKPGARHVYHLNGALGRGKESGDLAPQHAAGDTYFAAADSGNIYTVARHGPFLPGQTGVEDF